MKVPFLKSALVTALTIPFVSGTAIAAPETYTLDNDHTHIVWQVDRFGFTKTVGTFVDVTGTLTLDAEAPENSSVTAEIALSGLRSDLAEREEIVRGPYWLDAENHPVIRFTSTSVKPIADEDGKIIRAHVSGTMTLKGVSAPLVLDVALNKAGADPVSKKKAMGFSATGSFMRSKFGVKTAVGPVGDAVSFQIEALAIKTGE